MRYLFALILLLNTVAAHAIGEIPQLELNKGPLTVANAYQYEVFSADNQHHAVTWSIAPYYYLYRSKFDIQGVGVDIIDVAYPPSNETINDQYFGEQDVYLNFVQIAIVTSQPRQPDAHIVVKYQGCWQGGICYPPQQRIIRVADTAQPTMNTGTVNNLLANAVQNTAQPALAATIQQNITRLALANVITSTHQQLIQKLSNASWWVIALVFLGAGFALALTPCVYPTLPLIVSIVQASNVSRPKLFILLGIYIASFTLVYALGGLLIGIFGNAIQLSLQQPWLIIATAVIFVGLAGVMFGVGRLTLPHTWQNKLNAKLNTFSASSVLGMIATGMFSALLISPCMTAPLAALLAFLTHAGSPVIGGTALALVALGMSLPIVVIAILGKEMLPKSGAWLNITNQIIGFSLLFVAIWTLSRTVLPIISDSLFAVLFVVFAVYLGNRALLSKQLAVRTIGVSIAIFSLLYGALKFVQLFQPVLQTNAAAYQQTQQVVTTVPALDTALQVAKQQQQPAIVYVTAQWCISCKYIETQVLANNKFQTAIAPMKFIVVDVTAVNASSTALLAVFDLPGPPALYMFDSTGALQPRLSQVGDIQLTPTLALLHTLTK